MFSPFWYIVRRKICQTCHGSVVALDLQLPVVLAQQVSDLLVVDLDVGHVDLGSML
jgi:hypothetical protein